MALSEPLGTGLFVGNVVLGLTILMSRRTSCQVRGKAISYAYITRILRSARSRLPKERQGSWMPPAATKSSIIPSSTTLCASRTGCLHTIEQHTNLMVRSLLAPPQVAICPYHFFKDIAFYLIAVGTVLYCLLVGEVRTHRMCIMHLHTKCASCTYRAVDEVASL